MKIGITPFIAENVAPPNTKSLAVFKGDTKVGTVNISKMKPSIDNKLYSFGLLSDLHLSGNSTEGTRLNNALTFFENQGCAFCCHCGDMTNIGFWYNATDTEMYLAQMAEYKSVREAHPNLPLYGICGNHDSYSKPITQNLAELKEYTGLDLYYTITHNNDVFVFCGQNQGNKPMSNEALQWLGETLEANRDKRCFIFVHPYIDVSDCGNAFGTYGNDLFGDWGANKTTFINLLNSHKNTIVFHGHSHFMPELQEKAKNANYSKSLGFHSLHVPSISWNTDETLNENGGRNPYYDKSYGYIVDVYADCILLNGFNLLTNKPVPIARYCIDTAL